MSDPIQKLTNTIEKQRQAIEAQRAEAERIRLEREKQVTVQTGVSVPSQTQPPNK